MDNVGEALKEHAAAANKRIELEGDRLKVFVNPDKRQLERLETALDKLTSIEHGFKSITKERGNLVYWRTQNKSLEDKFRNVFSENKFDLRLIRGGDKTAHLLIDVPRSHRMNAETVGELKGIITRFAVGEKLGAARRTKK